MTKKKQFYESPQSQVCAELLSEPSCLEVSAEETMIYDEESYF